MLLFNKNEFCFNFANKVRTESKQNIIHEKSNLLDYRLAGLVSAITSECL